MASHAAGTSQTSVILRSICKMRSEREREREREREYFITERERERERGRERETDRQTETETDRETQRHREKDRWPETFSFCPLYVFIQFSAAFCTAHCALDLARDHAP